MINMKIGLITYQKFQPSIISQNQTTNFEGYKNCKKPKLNAINNKKNNFLLGFSGIISVILTFIAHKYNAGKNLISTNNKFTKLEKNLPKVQQCFKEVFLRKNLTEKETLEILNGYKEIEKRGVNLSAEDYAREVFNFAKKNYGIKNQSMKINFRQGFFLGYCNELNSEIVLSNDCLNTSKEKIFECIHHELRHAKQNDIVSTLYPEKFEIIAALSHLEEKIPDHIECNVFINNLCNKIGAKHRYDPIFTQEIKRMFPFEKIIKENLGILEPKNLTEEEKTLAENIAKEIGVAMNYNKRAEEVDAFEAARKIKDLLFCDKKPANQYSHL